MMSLIVCHRRLMQLHMVSKTFIITLSHRACFTRRVSGASVGRERPHNESYEHDYSKESRLKTYSVNIVKVEKYMLYVWILRDK